MNVAAQMVLSSQVSDAFGSIAEVLSDPLYSRSTLGCAVCRQWMVYGPNGHECIPCGRLLGHNPTIKFSIPTSPISDYREPPEVTGRGYYYGRGSERSMGSYTPLKRGATPRQMKLHE